MLPSRQRAACASNRPPQPLALDRKPACGESGGMCSGKQVSSTVIVALEARATGVRPELATIQCWDTAKLEYIPRSSPRTDPSGHPKRELFATARQQIARDGGRKERLVERRPVGEGAVVRVTRLNRELAIPEDRVAQLRASGAYLAP
jgi:hypothetical protein